jgi:hypothetical protein
MLNRTFWMTGKTFLYEMSDTGASSNMWLLNIWNVASVTQKMNFQFHLVLINLNVR